MTLTMINGYMMVVNQQDMKCLLSMHGCPCPNRIERTVTTMPMVDVSVLKEWVENWFYMNRNYHPYSKSNDIPIPELHDILERMPTVDVVRCRECKHNLRPDKPNSVCGLDIPIFDIYGYCSEGERREDGET